MAKAQGKSKSAHLHRQQRVMLALLQALDTRLVDTPRHMSHPCTGSRPELQTAHLEMLVLQGWVQA